MSWVNIIYIKIINSNLQLISQFIICSKEGKYSWIFLLPVCIYNMCLLHLSCLIRQTRINMSYNPEMTSLKMRIGSCSLELLS